MTTLNFQPLRHMKDLPECKCAEKKTCIHAKLKKPGVYIWGFLYERESNANETNSENTSSKLCDDHFKEKHNWKILNCKDDKIDKVYETINQGTKEPCSKYLFIPYYVGMSEVDVFGRLRDHKDFEEGDSTKYVRLHEDYMLCYHKHILPLNITGNSYPSLPLFPIKKASINNNFVWSLLAKDGYVHYFNRYSSNYINKNNKNAIEVAFDHEKENDNYSIMECDKHFNNDIKNKDPFKKRIEECNNFWFTYCDLSDDLLIQYLDSKVNKAEKDWKEAEAKKDGGNADGKLIKELNQDQKKLVSEKSNDEVLVQKLNNGNLGKNERKNLFHQAEAATYFALRGITFSRTHTVKFHDGWNVENNSGFDIFLDNASQNTLGKNNPRTCTPKDEFNWPGYW